MSRPEESTKNPTSTALAGAEPGPYTRPDEDIPAVNGAETERLRALGRQISDGLNLVHLRIGEMRQDLADSARTAATDRERRSAEAAADLERTRSEFVANLERISAEAAADRAAIRKEMTEGFAELREANRRQLEVAMKALEVATTALERSTAALDRKTAIALTRRQLAVGAGLVVIGAFLPRIIGWAVALFGS